MVEFTGEGTLTRQERSLSNSSSIFAPSLQPHLASANAAPMALNGSNFGAASSLDDYDEKDSMTLPSPPPPIYPGLGPGPIHPHAHDGGEEDYTSYPPIVQMSRIPSTGLLGNGYDSGDEDIHVRGERGQGYPYRLD